MESASRWTVSHTVVSVTRVTVVHSVTNRENCSIHVAAWLANMVGAKSQTLEMPTATVNVATLGNSVMQVGL